MGLLSTSKTKIGLIFSLYYSIIKPLKTPERKGQKLFITNRLSLGLAIHKVIKFLFFEILSS